ncbi:MAG: amino acid permease [Gammaproteobacteria bacterium]|nr:amino acid permease [Gammaproteobacteria bacterium]
MSEIELNRRITLPLLTFYGIGTILGAGIYVLIGEVAGIAGLFTPWSFLVASVLAGLSAFSYAELAARFPKSAGEAIYIHESFHHPALSLIVGLMIVAVGTISSATLTHGLLGYLAHFVQLPDVLVIVITVGILGGIVIRGIGESVIFASLMTLFEILGLLIVIWVARAGFTHLPAQLPQMWPGAHALAWSGILLGAFVAFYAFIGFEDMVNVAEEVIRPQQTLPRGIIIALVVTTAFYFLVALLSVLVVAPAALAQQSAPLAFIYHQMTGREPWPIALIGVASIVNGILIQMVMASRILYGMSRQRWLPGWLGSVNPRTRTPINATLVVLLLILAFAFWLPLLSLAKLTSFISLTIFSLINLALLRIKRRGEQSPGISVPLWVPACGFLFSVVFLAYQVWRW